MVAQLRATGHVRARRPIADLDGAEIREVEQIRTLYNDQRLGVREVGERLGIRPWRVYRLMCKHGIPRRRGSEQNYATYKHKPQFVPKAALTNSEDQLRIAGTMLYMGEGTKRGSTVDFTNTDPRLITTFVAFLRRVCGVSESRLRAQVYAYPDQDIVALHMFWAERTKIPRSQFIKPYVRPLTPNVSQRKMSLGLLHVRYNDRRLLELIGQWGNEMCHRWAGT